MKLTNSYNYMLTAAKPLPQMPSAMVGNNAVQSASPELGSGNHSEVMKQVLVVIDKKVRNMEKKKVVMSLCLTQT